MQGIDPPTLRRGIGYVIQQAGLFPHRKIVDNMATVPFLLGWSRKKARDRAMELLERVGLDLSLAERYPFQLSGGQQQRVGVARALAADPPVLLMDEPFSAVDPVVRTSLQDELLRLQAELNKTIVFVTHDIDEAIKLGDRVAVLRVGGQLAQLADPKTLLSEPADDFVREFLGRDRGIRRLQFVPTAGLPLRTDLTVPEGPTAPRTSRGCSPSPRTTGRWAGSPRTGPASWSSSARSCTARTRCARPSTRRCCRRRAARWPWTRRAGWSACSPGRRWTRRWWRPPMGDGPPTLWEWFARNWQTGRVGSISDLLGDHLLMSLVPIVAGLVLALPLGLASVRWRWLYQPTSGVIERDLRAALAAGVHAADLGHRAVPGHRDHPADLLRHGRAHPGRGRRAGAVPDHVRQSAVAMGFTPLRRLVAGGAADRRARGARPGCGWSPSPASAW